MSSLKTASALLTNEYIWMLCIETEIKAQGADAAIADINQISRIRAEISEADESLKYQLRTVLNTDTDRDCR